jgi:hypothetical protein
MPTYTAAAPAATPRTSYALESLEHLQRQLEDLKLRLTLALDNIAHEAGAWHCEHCGGWTLETVTVTSSSDERGEESSDRCRRCAPATAGCPF